MVGRSMGGRRGFWRDFSLQGKMLAIILPLTVVPVLILAAVGYITSSREAAKASTRFLLQRETDLRTLVENPAIAGYFNNKRYGLLEEAEVSRRELERSFRRFVDRSNAIEPVYRQVRYLDPSGREVAKVVAAEAAHAREPALTGDLSSDIKQLGPGEVYLSPVAPTRIYAMPVYQPAAPDRLAVFLGTVRLDFQYPVQEFQRTTAVIAWTFLIITAISLGLAVFLVVNRVGRLTDPIRRLAEAANRIAGGQRSVAVAIDSRDEIGRLAAAFNDMATSLGRNEAALQRKVDETRSLYEIGQEVTAQVALEPTLHLIVERARHLLGADACLLSLRQSESNALAARAHAERGTETRPGLLFRATEELSARVVSGGEAVIVDDCAAEYEGTSLARAAEDAGIRSALAVPLRGRGTVIGVLNVQSRTPRQFGNEDRQLLNALADQAAVALE